MWDYLDRGCTVCLVAESFTCRFACIGHTPPALRATSPNLEGELNLAGVQRVSSSSPKLGEVAQSAGGVCILSKYAQPVTSIEVQFL